MKKDANYQVTPKMQQELARLAVMKDEDICLNDTDIPSIENWDNAVHGKFYRPFKQSITIRVDRDVLAWFKARKGAYQTSINKALREYIIAHTQK